MVLKSSGKLAVIWKNPDSFEIIRKIGYHLENPYSFEIIRKIGSHLEKSGQFWNNPENWQSSGKSRQFWNHLENWQSSGKSGQFWNHPENWQSSGKKSGQFWNHPENWKSSGKIRIVLKVLRQFKRFFRLYAQKLSGRAKTFRVAMLPCYPGFCASDLDDPVHQRRQILGRGSRLQEPSGWRDLPDKLWRHLVAPVGPWTDSKTLQ